MPEPPSVHRCSKFSEKSVSTRASVTYRSPPWSEARKARIDTTRERSSTTRTEVSNSSWRISYSEASRASTCSFQTISTSTFPPKPSRTRLVMASHASHSLGLAVGSEQADLVRRDLLHGIDAAGLDHVRFAHLRVLQHRAHFLEVGDLDIAGDVDLIDAQLGRLPDFVIGVPGAAMEYQGDVDGRFDLLEQIELEFGHDVGREQAVRGADRDGQAVRSGLLDELDCLIGRGVDDVGGAGFAVAVGGADRAQFGLDAQAHGMDGLGHPLGDPHVLFEGVHGSV